MHQTRGQFYIYGHDRKVASFPHKGDAILADILQSVIDIWPSLALELQRPVLDLAGNVVDISKTLDELGLHEVLFDVTAEDWRLDWTEAPLEELIRNVLAVPSTGLEQRTHKIKGKKVRECFTGQAFVDWFVRNNGASLRAHVRRSSSQLWLRVLMQPRSVVLCSLMASLCKCQSRPRRCSVMMQAPCIASLWAMIRTSRSRAKHLVQAPDRQQYAAAAISYFGMRRNCVRRMTD